MSFNPKDHFETIDKLISKPFIYGAIITALSFVAMLPFKYGDIMHKYTGFIGPYRTDYADYVYDIALFCFSAGLIVTILGLLVAFARFVKYLLKLYESWKNEKKQLVILLENVEIVSSEAREFIKIYLEESVSGRFKNPFFHSYSSIGKGVLEELDRYGFLEEDRDVGVFSVYLSVVDIYKLRFPKLVYENKLKFIDKLK